METLLLKIADVAVFVGLSRAKVYELDGSGHLTAVKIGGCRRVRVSDLQDSVDNLGRAL